MDKYKSLPMTYYGLDGGWGQVKNTNEFLAVVDTGLY